MMSDSSFFGSYFGAIGAAVANIDPQLLIKAVGFVNDCMAKNGKVILAGNGGSAAMASHVSVDFTKAASVRAVNFNEADLITCFANDYGYENWLSKALEAYADPHDLIVLISSSGQSMNMIKAAEYCRSEGMPLITLSGFKESNPLKEKGQINLWVDSDHYNVVEMTHHIWLLSLVDFMISQRH